MLIANFIIDCGLKSGLGHLRRSLVLASALRDKGVECNILISSDIGAGLVEQYNFHSQSASIEILPTANLLVIDGNSFTEKQIKDWSASSQCLCIIEDNGLRPIACDILINPNLYSKTISYEHYTVSRFLLGPDYHLVADEFFVEKSGKSRPIDYLISFGGSDDGKLALPVIEKLIAKFKGTIVWAVPSHVEPNEDVLGLASRHDIFSIMVDEHIPILFAQTKCFIGGAGAMVLEALVSGCTVIVCAVVPDQCRNIEYLQEHNIPAFPKFDADEIIRATQQPYGLNSALVELDANGAAKIADVILAELKQ